MWIALSRASGNPGWQAFLNDAPIPIRSDLGFMAVDVPAGESALRFRYTIPGLKAGIVLSGIGAAGILILLAGNARGPEVTIKDWGSEPVPPDRFQRR